METFASDDDYRFEDLLRDIRQSEAYNIWLLKRTLTSSELRAKEAVGVFWRPFSIIGGGRVGDSKPFRTVEQQIAILESRGVSFQDEGYAASFLLRENYYAVVNGYKDALIDKQETNLAKEDRYVRGTDFRHFELMYEFDKRLRDNTMALLLDCENLMKTAVVYSFCSIHQGQDDYLDPSCYCSKADFPKRGSYTKGLIRLLSTLQRLRDNGPHKAYISHYASRYGCPPLWVLSKCLTFGSTSAFFDYQQQSVKNRTCVTLSQALGKGVVRQRDLAYAFHTLPEFRNICAHGERLYCARVGKLNDKGFGELLRALSYVAPADRLAEYSRSVLLLLDDVADESALIERKLLLGMGIARGDLQAR